MEVIYIDSLFFLNLIIDYLLLLCAGKISAVPLKRLRIGAAAAAGGAYAVLAVLVPDFFALATVKLLVGALLVFIAYGKKKYAKTLVVFYAVAAAFGGAVYAVTRLGITPGTARLYIPVSMKVLALSFAVCYAALTLVFRRAGAKSERETLTVKISFLGRNAEFTALRDTGNDLFDPITGESVLVVSKDVISALFPEDAQNQLQRDDILSAFEELSGLPELKGRLRILSFKSVGEQSGLMLCFRPDEIEISGEGTGRRLVGISRTQLSKSGDFEAVIR